MNNLMSDLTYKEILIFISIGFALGIVYFYLLWQTILTLPRVQHKNLFLFLSGALRIFLLIFIALVFSNSHPGRFLLIFIGVIVIRLLIMKYMKKSIREKLRQNELPKATPEKATSKTKISKQKRK